MNCKSALERFCIFSNLFKFQRVGTPIINEWNGVAMLCCKGKDSFHLKSCRYGYICLFVLDFTSHSKIFHSYGGITIAVEGLQILTYAQHLWPFSSEVSLTCYTHCDTGLPFIMVISEDPWHSHLLPSAWQWSYHYLFFVIGDRTPNLPHARLTLYFYAIAAVLYN